MFKLLTIEHIGKLSTGVSQSIRHRGRTEASVSVTRWQSCVLCLCSN